MHLFPKSVCASLQFFPMQCLLSSNLPIHTDIESCKNNQPTEATATFSAGSRFIDVHVNWRRGGIV